MIIKRSIIDYSWDQSDRMIDSDRSDFEIGEPFDKKCALNNKSR